MTFMRGRWWHNPRVVKGSMLAVAMLLTACSGLPTTPLPPAGTCEFPSGTHFAFFGTTNAAGLGLSTDTAHVGRWWVTSERLLWRFPYPAGLPLPPPARQACGLLDDGSVVIQRVPENWHAPLDASSP
jgi:hypothetical protein